MVLLSRPSADYFGLNRPVKVSVINSFQTLPKPRVPGEKWPIRRKFRRRNHTLPLLLPLLPGYPHLRRVRFRLRPQPTSRVSTTIGERATEIRAVAGQPLGWAWSPRAGLGIDSGTLPVRLRGAFLASRFLMAPAPLCRSTSEITKSSLPDHADNGSARPRLWPAARSAVAIFSG